MKTAVDAHEPKARAAALVRVGDDLTKHITSEEQVFYPAVKAKRTEDILLESLEEHLSLKRLLADLLTMDPAATRGSPNSRCLRSKPSIITRKRKRTFFPRCVKRWMRASSRASASKCLRYSKHCSATVIRARRLLSRPTKRRR